MKLFEDLKDLDSIPYPPENPRAVPKAYMIIHDLAEAQFFEAHPYFRTGLDNQDPHYRYACISALATHWKDGDPGFLAKLVGMARHDPDAFVRMIAIDSLGWLRVHSALPELKRIVENEQEDAQNRQTAYVSILRLLDFPSAAFPVWADYDNFEDNLIDKGLLATISGSSFPDGPGKERGI